MHVKIINPHDTMEFDCSEINSEMGLIVFRETEDKEIFVSPSIISIMEITGRPKKKEEKKPEKTKKSVSI